MPKSNEVISTIEDLVQHANSSGILPIEIDINGPGDFSIKGIARTRRSLMGALKKVADARESEELSDFPGSKQLAHLLEAWKGGGGGFSGGGASGKW
ncbi:hypothetical protein [Variovorax sp. tm]|uniref:hypothetical protein n=1 Tax=Variovorax atrisoli TaxID=3394203 RepID=UPI003A807290